MVNKEVIRKRLARLDEYLGVLGGLQEYTREEFLGNPGRYGSASGISASCGGFSRGFCEAVWSALAAMARM